MCIHFLIILKFIGDKMVTNYYYKFVSWGVLQSAGKTKMYQHGHIHIFSTSPSTLTLVHTWSLATLLSIYTPSSNHPTSILKNIPLAVNKRLCSISSDENSFYSESRPYLQALSNSRYKHQLKYRQGETTTKPKRTACAIPCGITRPLIKPLPPTLEEISQHHD